MSMISQISSFLSKLYWKKKLNPSESQHSLHRVLEQYQGVWKKAVHDSRGGKRVLVATSMGGFQAGAMLESVLSAALTLRGAEVSILLCDSYLPACQITTNNSAGPERMLQPVSPPKCGSCYPAGKRMFEPLGLPIHWYSQLVSDSMAKEAAKIAEELPFESIPDFRLDGLAIGEHAMAGALRYFARGDLQGEVLGEAILRLYLRSSLLVVYAIRSFLECNSYDVVCFNHGIYAPQGLIGEVCRQKKIRVVNWNPAYRQHTFVFSHDDSYHHTMITEPTADWENLDWSTNLETVSLKYLKSRWHGTQDWIWFHEKPIDDIDSLAEVAGVDFSRPVVGMLTSVMWDAQLHYRSNAFPNMLSWVLWTIKYFAHRPDLQLIIRVHPAEIRGTIPSRQPLVKEIKQMFPVLPPNVFVIPPESQVSTYAVMERCSPVIIYNTKMGIELSGTNIPVIVAGEAWIRNKGFSHDASSPDEYRQILDTLPLLQKLTPNQLLRAKKYAFHFFFRRMIPLHFITGGRGAKLELELINLKELLPGKHIGLDVICDGILKETPFIYPAENYL